MNPAKAAGILSEQIGRRRAADAVLVKGEWSSLIFSPKALICRASQASACMTVRDTEISLRLSFQRSVTLRSRGADLQLITLPQVACVVLSYELESYGSAKAKLKV